MSKQASQAKIAGHIKQAVTELSRVDVPDTDSWDFELDTEGAMDAIRRARNAIAQAERELIGALVDQHTER